MFNGVFTLCVGVFVGLFIGEKKFHKDDILHVFHVFKAIPKYLTNKKYLFLIIFMLITNGSSKFVSSIFTLKFVRSGFERAIIVNIDTIIVPLSLIASIYLSHFLKKGKLLQIYILSLILLLLVSCLTFAILIYWESTHSKLWVIVSLIFTNLLAIPAMPLSYIYSFINLVVDESLGSTGITLFTTLWNVSNNVPNTIGLSIVEHVDFGIYAGIVLGISAVVLSFSVNIARKMDRDDIEE